MPTVIDSLLITLGYDTSGLRRGQGEAGKSLDNLDKASDKHAKAQAARSRAMADGFNKVKNEIVSMVAVLVGANSIKGFVNDTVTAQTALGRMALNLGTSGRELDAWGAAVESVGGKKSDFQASAQAIAGTLEEIKATGNAPPAFMGAMNALNVSMLDAKGNMRDVSDIMGQINKGLQNRNLTEQDKMYLAKALGLDAGTFNLLRQSPEKVQALVDKMRNLSGVSEDGAKVTARMQEKWAIFKQSFDGLMTGAFIRVAPELEKIMDSSERLASRLIDKLVPAIKEGVKWFGGLMDILDEDEAEGKPWTPGVLGSVYEAGQSVGNAIRGWFGMAPADTKPAPAAPLGSKETWAISSLQESVGKKRVFALSNGKMETREGGTVSWRNNNPGNLKFEYSGSADKTVKSGRSKEAALAAARKRYGNDIVDLDQWGNAIFSTEEAGRAAQAILLKKQHGGKTIEEMLPKYAISDYSGSANVDAYAKSIYKFASSAGASLQGRKIGEMNDREMGILTTAMKKVEGWKEGTSTVSTNIQNMTINTQATTADAIARDMQAALQRQAAVYSHAAGAQ